MAKTAPRDIEARERAGRALELRREGKPFDEIAREIGYNSPQAAHMAVSRALKALVHAPAADLARLELERLDAVHAAAWPAAVSGDLAAIDRVLKVSERRAKLCGLDGRALPRADLPRTLAAAVAVRTPAADGDEKPNPRADALARLDLAAEIAWPIACSGDMGALDKLITIATARAKLTGADQAPIDDGLPDPLVAMVDMLARSRAALVANRNEDAEAERLRERVRELEARLGIPPGESAGSGEGTP